MTGRPTIYRGARFLSEVRSGGALALSVFGLRLLVAVHVNPAHIVQLRLLLFAENDARVRPEVYEQLDHRQDDAVGAPRAPRAS